MPTFFRGRRTSERTAYQFAAEYDSELMRSPDWIDSMTKMVEAWKQSWSEVGQWVIVVWKACRR